MSWKFKFSIWVIIVAHFLALSKLTVEPQGPHSLRLRLFIVHKVGSVEMRWDFAMGIGDANSSSGAMVKLFDFGRFDKRVTTQQNFFVQGR